MNAYVVDTNVAIVANRKCNHADPKCVIACIDALENIIDRGVIVLDDDMFILNEYMRNLSLSGQPGAGDLFMKWVWTHQANNHRCEKVQLTLRNNRPDDYVEFPNDPQLVNFDRSDRKFVAAALKSTKQPDILNAVDKDWSDHHAALRKNGVSVKFLCPQHAARS